MYARYNEGQIGLRTLAADDVAGVCAIYPPPPNLACDATPRHGFSTECGSPAPPTTKGCCSTAPGAPSGAAGSAALAALALAVGFGARRRGARRGEERP